MAHDAKWSSIDSRTCNNNSLVSIMTNEEVCCFWDSSKRFTLTDLANVCDLSPSKVLREAYTDGDGPS